MQETEIRTKLQKMTGMLGVAVLVLAGNCKRTRSELLVVAIEQDDGDRFLVTSWEGK
jgi:hypothetical protein